MATQSVLVSGPPAPAVVIPPPIPVPVVGVKRKLLDEAELAELRRRAIEDWDKAQKSLESTRAWLDACIASAPPKSKRAKSDRKQRKKADERVVIESRKMSEEDIRALYGDDVMIANISTDNTAKFRYLHPTFPHGGIPVPGATSDDDVQLAASVEGLYEGLKVFTNTGISTTSMTNTDMRNIKRYQSQSKGKFLGYKGNIHNDALLNEEEAREAIYLPAFKYVLDGPANAYLHPLIEALDEGRRVVLVDSKKQQHKLSDTQHPVSYAVLIASYLKGTYPQCADWRMTTA